VKIVARKFDRAVHRLPIPQHLWTKFDLLKTLVQRDLEAKYKGSILGNAWAILNQLAQLLVYTYLFSIVLKVKLNIRGLPANDFTFGLWMFAGLIPWTAFTAGFMGSATSVISQPNLIKKVVFPLALLPLVPICTHFDPVISRDLDTATIVNGGVRVSRSRIDRISERYSANDRCTSKFMVLPNSDRLSLVVNP
jgi:lipopolysaccharide transport system permease protein